MYKLLCSKFSVDYYIIADENNNYICRFDCQDYNSDEETRLEAVKILNILNGAANEPTTPIEEVGKKTIELPIHNIVVTLDGEGGYIRSCLGQFGNTPEDDVYNAAIDALESLILAHACAGIDISSPAYLEGIETAVDAIPNEID